MRSDEELPAEQLALGERCEALLASDKWNRAHTVTHAGLLERLQMIVDAGLPPMRLLSAKKLEELGRIPRSDEGHQEVVKRCGVDINNRPKAALLFYSHRWSRPNWCEVMQLEAAWGSAERTAAEAEGAQFGDPRTTRRTPRQRPSCSTPAGASATGTKEAVARSAPVCQTSPPTSTRYSTGWTTRVRTRPHPAPTWRPSPPMSPSAPPSSPAGPTHTPRGRGAASRCCSYAAHVVRLCHGQGDSMLVLPESFVDEEQPAVDEQEDTLLDPAEGLLTMNPSDKAVIASLRRVAERSTAFSCWRNCVKDTSRCRTGVTTAC